MDIDSLEEMDPDNFLLESDDCVQYLMTSVCIFLIEGICQRRQLNRTTIQDSVSKGSEIVHNFVPRSNGVQESSLKVSDVVHDSIYRGSEFLRDCPLGDHYCYFDLLHMELKYYVKLCKTLKHFGRLHDARDIEVEEQVAIFLFIVGHSEPNRAVQYVFQRSGQTISKYFNLVLDAICHMGPLYIRQPNIDTLPNIRAIPKFDLYFKDCLGGINCMHVPVWVPKESLQFRDRRGVLSQSVLATVGLDMQFSYVLAGLEGSITNVRALYSALNDQNYPLMVPEGKYYLADARYRHISGILTPYRGSRYHLLDSNVHHAGTIHSPEELFNHQHSSLRATVERVFGLLKARFPILKVQAQYPLATQVKIILACCVLHNFIIGSNPDALQFSDDSTDNFNNDNGLY